jgi:hypothetical protein
VATASPSIGSATVAAPAPSIETAPPAATVAPAPVKVVNLQAADVQQPIDKSNMTPTDAYWAEQPTPVQALRYMPDEQKFDAAQDLAKQGYSIDVPIMMWGWDPLTTMTIRQNDGLTWVPSAMQPNIPVSPGNSFPGLPSYDATKPPAGSIMVSTAFAQGTNMQDPWILALQS